MEESTKKELTQQLLAAIQRLHAGSHPPQPSEKMRGAPMILHYIRSHDGDVSPGEISRQLGTSTARITAVLGNLEKKGLLVRTMDPGDRRKIRISLTEEGARYVEKMERDMVAMMQNLITYMGEEDVRMMLHLMDKLKDWKPEDVCDADKVRLLEE